MTVMKICIEGWNEVDANGWVLEATEGGECRECESLFALLPETRPSPTLTDSVSPRMRRVEDE